VDVVRLPRKSSTSSHYGTSKGDPALIGRFPAMQCSNPYARTRRSKASKASASPISGLISGPKPLRRATRKLRA